MAPCGFLLLLVAVAAASSLLAAASPAALHAVHHEPEPPSRELPAADPAAGPRTVLNDDDDAVLPGACGGLVIPPHMIRAAVPAGPRGVYDVTVVLRATRHRGQYYVVPGSVGGGGDDGHRDRDEVVPMLIAGLVVWGVTFIFLFCLEMITGLRGDGGDDEAYSGGGNDAFPMKSVLVDLAHADAVKVKQQRSDN